MDFCYLYNPDNGICTVYNEFVSKNRSDLVPLTKEEGVLLRTMSVGEIIALRAQKAAPTASVMVETNDVSKNEEVAPMPVSDAPKAKGVVVVGKKSVPTESEKKEEIVFEDAKKDYKRFHIPGGDFFPVEDLSAVADEDLVRFAKEVMNRNYEDAPVVANDIERADYYSFLRDKIYKALARLNKKRIACKARKEAERNGVND